MYFEIQVYWWRVATIREWSSTIAWSPTRPCRRHQPVERGEVRRPVLLADRLDHLHAHDRVVLALRVAVVAQLDVDAIADARGRGALPGQRSCCSLEIVSVVTCAPATRGADRQRSPAGADLEHSGAERDADRVEQTVDLPGLRDLERCLPA